MGYAWKQVVAIKCAQKQRNQLHIYRSSEFYDRAPVERVKTDDRREGRAIYAEVEKSIFERQHFIIKVTTACLHALIPNCSFLYDSGAISRSNSHECRGESKTNSTRKVVLSIDVEHDKMWQHQTSSIFRVWQYKKLWPILTSMLYKSSLFCCWRWLLGWLTQVL